MDMEAHWGRDEHFWNRSPRHFRCHLQWPLKQGVQLGAVWVETGRWSIPTALHSQIPQHPRLLPLILH